MIFLLIIGWILLCILVGYLGHLLAVECLAPYIKTNNLLDLQIKTNESHKKILDEIDRRLDHCKSVLDYLEMDKRRND
jgi:hypothetical protein